ncbi:MULTISPECIES: S1/P1 nuclease [unclassified Roseateles]|uniref:S1/P1 nuclease n=1 Tax=unclassified Roseateles TaxID=2626991 RepID=UPI0006FB6503|nr:MULTISPECIES: S1/P1 nuclease [unclassified Roseateles]KQW51211.1 hypothetical protein ASC81_00715 [Pelomonas sp. Root405]KRA77443.1 hypothetical protein ASD88_00715 [Pelomonas sp. Root662]
MRFFTHLAVLSGLAAPLSASAWGADGHRLIAELAESQLSPAAAAEVGRLLSLEPGATMVSVSTWADEKRSGVTAPLHYVNLPEGDCTYRRERDCAGGRCLVEAIVTKVQVLKSAAPDTERLLAMKYLIHFVGDIHQPLHVGLASDKGGNQFQVRAFGRGSNLHAVWDGDLIRRRAGGMSQLLQEASAAAPRTHDTVDPARWARESCIVRSAAGFYPLDRTTGPSYAARWDGTLVAQIALAGRRLAEALNSVVKPR